jgi:hypothetical protein
VRGGEFIVFLCSTANGNITGETIRADNYFLTRG